MASGDSKDPASTSLEDRITMPSKENADATSAKLEDKPAEKSMAASNDSKDLPETQIDGASDQQNGSQLNEPEFDVEVKLSDMQADPNNPLYSAKTFEQLGLPEGVLKGIYAMNFRKPSKIQERALPLLLNNPPTNMIGQSQSGTGKTAAFTLNMLARCDLSIKSPQALVLAPSRELARQILGVVQVMGQFVPGLEVGQAVPDEVSNKNKMEGQIIVGTPGTVMNLLRRSLLDKEHVKVLVLDEADSMLAQQNLGTQCEQVKSRLPKTVQVVLFSATFPEHVIRFADRFAPHANQITLKHEELTVEGIRQLYMDCQDEEAKYDALVKLYGLMTIGSSIIFVRTRESADRIQKRMTDEGHQVVSLTGALEGKDRDTTIDAFRDGRAKVLITTNVLARGIDVQSVSMVINYDVPTTSNGMPDPETYLHRIGRTGRFGRVGVAITFVYDEKSWKQLYEITKYFDVSPTRLDTRDWNEVEDKVRKVIKSSRAGTNMKMEA